MLPFDCGMYPAVNKCNNNKSIIIVQKHSYFMLNIYSCYVDSITERIIWIGFYKNTDNNKCFIHKLPKDIMHYILHLLGKKLLVKPYIKIDI